MIKKFHIYINENHENDPFDEEDWDDKKVIKEGDKVTCLMDYPYDDRHNYTGIDVKKGDVYTAKWILGPFLYLEELPGFLSIDKFKKINETHENDPFNEENWGNDEFEAGDDIICIEKAFGITAGKIYRVIEVDKNNNPRIRLDNDTDSGYYFKFRFKKVKLNENHLDIDPYSEENWNELPNKVKVLPNIIKYVEELGYSEDYLKFIGKTYPVMREGMFRGTHGHIKTYIIQTSFEQLYHLPEECAEIVENVNEEILLVNNGYEYAFRLGEIVRMSDTSKFREQAYMSSGDGTGTIDEIYEPSSEGFCYCVLWKNGMRRNYRPEDLIKIAKRITRPDIDPLDEEDWGYETNENHLDIDPLGFR
jgi:hypothetical protein